MGRNREDRVIQTIAHIVMLVISVLAVVPFWLLISSSLSDDGSVVAEGYKFIPQKFSLSAYQYLLDQKAMILRSYGVTIVVTVLATALAIVLTTMFAYGLLQKVPGVKIIFALVIFTMLFNGGIVPTYYIYTNVLHVKNTIWGLLFPNLLINGFNVILVRNYIMHSVPLEITEAAEIDGCGQFGICFKIVFPLSTPILATVGLVTGVTYWNDWTNGLYYITDDKLYSIQQLLNEMNNNIQFLSNHASSGIVSNNLPANTVRMAIAVVAIIPILCIYPFFQKYFAKGIVMGAVKG